MLSRPQPAARPESASAGCLSDDGAGVGVNFEHVGTKRFDLVVAAEGVGSSTRRLVFVDAARVELFGLDSAYFTIPKGQGDGEDTRWFNAPVLRISVEGRMGR